MIDRYHISFFIAQNTHELNVYKNKHDQWIWIVNLCIPKSIMQTGLKCNIYDFLTILFLSSIYLSSDT